MIGDTDDLNPFLQAGVNDRTIVIVLIRKCRRSEILLQIGKRIHLQGAAIKFRPVGQE